MIIVHVSSMFYAFNFYNHGIFKYDVEKLMESKKLLSPILALRFV